MSAPDHEHSWCVVKMHENRYRVRTYETCGSPALAMPGCGKARFGCFAKEVGTDGQRIWGPVGEWRYSEAAT